VVRRVAFAVPGDLATPTGGYAYDRRMIAELQRLGWQVDVIALGDGFPRPSAAQKTLAEARLASAPGDGPIVIDGLALGVLPEAAVAVRARRPLIALIHHPLALESGLSAADADACLLRITAWRRPASPWRAQARIAPPPRASARTAWFGCFRSAHWSSARGSTC
jgi:hypothetical protein